MSKIQGGAAKSGSVFEPFELTHAAKKNGGESHAPGLPVYQLSIDTTFVGYISFICPG